jgi:polyferredoxin
LSRSAVRRSLGGQDDGPWWQSVIFSFLHVGLILSVVLSFLPSEGVSALSPAIRSVFTGANQQFGWIIAPVLAMLIFGKKKRKKHYDDGE